MIKELLNSIIERLYGDQDNEACFIVDGRVGRKTPASIAGVYSVLFQSKS
jgi:hypothetical protein